VILLKDRWPLDIMFSAVIRLSVCSGVYPVGVALLFPGGISWTWGTGLHGTTSSAETRCWCRCLTSWTACRCAGQAPLGRVQTSGRPYSVEHQPSAAFCTLCGNINKEYSTAIPSTSGQNESLLKLGPSILDSFPNRLFESPSRSYASSTMK